MPRMEKEITELVARLQAAYEDREMTQQGFADALGVGRNRARNWLHGNNGVHLNRSVQLALADFLGVSPLDVLRLHGLSVSDERPSS